MNNLFKKLYFKKHEEEVEVISYTLSTLHEFVESENCDLTISYNNKFYDKVMNCYNFIAPIYSNGELNKKELIILRKEIKSLLKDFKLIII